MSKSETDRPAPSTCRADGSPAINRTAASGNRIREAEMSISPVRSQPAAASRTEPAASATVGSQTLARGLHALQLVATAPEPVPIAQVAQKLDVHRTIAYRVLATLENFRYLHRLPDGRYIAGNALAALTHNVEMQLREVTHPILRDLAERIAATVALYVAEGDEAVSLAVVEPTAANVHVSFQPGRRHPLHNGSAGYALVAALPPRPGEPHAATLARKRGYALSHSEIEPGTYSAAVPLHRAQTDSPACISLMAISRSVADAAIPHLLDAAEEINRRLELTNGDAAR